MLSVIEDCADDFKVGSLRGAILEIRWRGRRKGKERRRKIINK
jgi:hypothetical protein